MEASSHVEKILSSIRSLPAYQTLLGDLQERKPLEGLSLARSVRLPLVAALHQDLKRPILFITDRADRANSHLDEIRFWMEHNVPNHFPEPTPLFYENAAWGTQTRRDRLQTLSALAAQQVPGFPNTAAPPMIIAPLRAVMVRTLPRRDYLRHCKRIKLSEIIQPEALRRLWVDIGYQPADTVLEPGFFAQRGGILDVWIPSEALPVRLDFFGDELDTIRQFDPTTQRTTHTLNELFITPAREILPAQAERAGIPFQEIDEFQIPVVYSNPSSILDYLPPNALIIVEDLDLLHSMAEEVEEQAVKFREESIIEGTLPENFPLPYLTWSEIEDHLQVLKSLELAYSTAVEPSALARHFNPGPRFGGRLKDVTDYLLEHAEKQEEMYVISRQRSRLEDLWSDHSSFVQAPLKRPIFIDNTLTEGWVMEAAGKIPLHLLTDSEIFGWDRPQARKRKVETAEPPEAQYEIFNPGDWVVHVDHGIGRFKGLVTRTLEGIEREYLCVAYANDAEIFVPIHQADRLTRYIGGDARPPDATRLGGVEWENTKKRVQKSLEQVAEDLLEIYAKRQMVEGFSFSSDTPWQNELEASFPYVETQDQLQAIHEVKHDMERSRPMDRLLCGDVGYGKTEVALRAAFKAVMDGKQVALLAPTTVLAQQHYETFGQRLTAFPVQVEMLSRFRNPREQREILFKLYQGNIDIIIGTHRLLQSDVIFKDIGLLIIDEEQRFGVSHKEYFKKLRTELDVLTLTATPIPRTLYMALTGARDISTINTPPQERLPIITHIGPYSDRIVRQAVLRELERGGQIFFVHNRVMTIEGMRQHLKQLVPEARIGVGHGQMHENELSEVMHQFTAGAIDILLCTSIIESGLDIPNANTLIVDRADTFGLAQLYQLRGRVGRGAQRAYSYFFRHRTKPPTPEGQERLEIIAENTQLGSGYSIAMRDLEMRGAGELLGTRQHGNIHAVGFHLYTRLLAQAVHQLRQEQGLELPETEVTTIKGIGMPVAVELPLAVGIDPDYVTRQDLRLKLYRRIADLDDQQAIDALAEEFEDRFGPIPHSTQNLFYQMRVKLMAEEAGLSSVSMENGRLVLRFPPLPEGIKSRNLPILGMNSRAGKNAYWVMTNPEQDWQQHLLQVLYELIHELKIQNL
ncbi:MAG: transcription-repair coupling factor [Anaerolineaceae bacterium]|nr:transcription-repair coupling factor [Anaerolineaceae bacterium]